MRLTDTQVNALRWTAGLTETQPRSNTLSSLVKRGLIDDTEGHVLTDAGVEALHLAQVRAGEVAEEAVLEVDVAPLTEVQMYGEPGQGASVAIDPGNTPGVVVESLTDEAEKMLSGFVAAYRTKYGPVQQRRAKNRAARKSRRVNRQRAK